MGNIYYRSDLGSVEIFGKLNDNGARTEIVFSYMPDDLDSKLVHNIRVFYHPQPYGAPSFTKYTFDKISLNGNEIAEEEISELLFKEAARHVKSIFCYGDI